MIFLSSLLIAGCSDIQENHEEHSKIEKKKVHKEDINKKVQNYIDKMLIEYDLKTVEGMRDSLFYFDDIIDIYEEKKNLTDRESYYLTELKRNKEILEDYINSNSDERIMSDFEKLNLEYVSSVLLPFHSINNNFKLLIRDERAANEFFDISIQLINDVFLLEQYTNDQLLKDLDKEYLIYSNPVDLVQEYVVNNKKYSNSDNEFEIVMYSAIQKAYLEWTTEDDGEYKPISPMLMKFSNVFPKKYLDEREELKDKE